MNIDVREEVGYDLTTKSTIVILKVFTNNKDYVVQEPLTVKEMSHGRLHDWAELIFKMIWDLDGQLLGDGVVAGEVNFPELAPDKVSRVLQIPFPFNLTKDEFIRSYSRIDGIG